MTSPTKPPALPAEVRAVQRQFEKWRRNRPRLTRIPDSLWAAAISLHPRHSLTRIARILHLERAVLRQHLPPTNGHERKVARKQRFIQLAPPAGEGFGEYLIEVQEAAGRFVRVRIPGSHGLEGVMELIRRLRQDTA